MAEDTKQCRAIDGWTIVVPRNFAEIDNGDSWQAHSGTRFVYVSSIRVTDANGPAPAAALFATASKKLAPASEAERHSFEEPGLNAGAQIMPTEAGFDLKGFTCVDGVVATCVISFVDQTDREWAVNTWRSLCFTASKPKPWWRLW